MNRHKGFTLVELIVSLGLFSFVVTLAAGAYLVMINVNREAQSISTGVNSLAFVLEGMTRNIRTGGGYGCYSDPTTFSFYEDGAVTIEAKKISFRLDSDRHVVQRKKGTGEWTDLTDARISVNTLSFICQGTNLNTNDTYDNPARQAWVRINISGTVYAGPGKLKEFNLQTSATMRGIDL